ncbi:MAG: flagellar assembly protein FliW [Candidatus Cloacimonetes bacterium]|nr:flagellar assembly protein FliW [Candidatus Cloacimonadota bacterium]
MNIKTKRFGEIDIDPKSTIHFPSGLLGFAKSKDFVLLDPSKKSPLKWLQSVDEPELAFVVTDPLIFKPDYEIRVFESDLLELKVEDPSTVVQLVIVTVPRDPARMTANLKGPLLINTANNIARQLVLDNPDYEIKHRLLSDAASAKAV